MTVILEKTALPEIEDPFEHPRVLIRLVDDNVTTAKSLAFFLEALGFEVKIWNNPKDFLNEYQNFKEDGCLILDVRMPQMSGLELFQALKDQGFSLPIIFLTGHGDVEMAVEAVKSGAFDFLLKPPSEEKLVTTIKKAIHLSLEKRKSANEKEARKIVFDSLTAREKDVVSLVAQGKLNKVIAAELDISEKTVQQHRGVACHKLGVKSVPELIDFLRLLQS